LDHALDLEGFARLRAELSGGAPAHEVVARAGLSVDRLPSEEESWLVEVTDSAAKDRRALIARYNAAFEARRRALGLRDPIRRPRALDAAPEEEPPRPIETPSFIANAASAAIASAPEMQPSASATGTAPSAVNSPWASHAPLANLDWDSVEEQAPHTLSMTRQPSERPALPFAAPTNAPRANHPHGNAGLPFVTTSQATLAEPARSPLDQTMFIDTPTRPSIPEPARSQLDRTMPIVDSPSRPSIPEPARSPLDRTMPIVDSPSQSSTPEPQRSPLDRTMPIIDSKQTPVPEPRQSPLDRTMPIIDSPSQSSADRTMPIIDSPKQTPVPEPRRSPLDRTMHFIDSPPQTPARTMPPIQAAPAGLPFAAADPSNAPPRTAAQNTEGLPFRPPSPSERRRRLTLEQFASLVAEASSRRAPLAELCVRYGLNGESAYGDEVASWKLTFAERPEEHGRYAALLERYRTWLARLAR
jgi:hypothetical protein